MILFNTTYHVDEAEEGRWMTWLKETYMPRAMACGRLSSPHLYRLLMKQEHGYSYSLQFRVKDTSQIHQWYTVAGQMLEVEMRAEFGESVVGFATLMEEQEL